MNKSMRIKLVFILMSCGMISLFPLQWSFAQGSKYLSVIELKPYDKKYPIMPVKLSKLSRKIIPYEVELGETTENQLIVLHPRPNVLNEFKIEERFETSLTVMGEGPHLDLLNWKHYYSTWRELKKVGKNRFLTPTISEAEASKFPKVSAKEIQNAILKYGDKWWLEHARKVKSPHDSPCGVGISKIWYRILVKNGDQWVVINTIAVDVPMGC